MIPDSGQYATIRSQKTVLNRTEKEFQNSLYFTRSYFRH